MSITPDRGPIRPDLLDLMEHEKIIEQGIASMRDMAWSWRAIRDDRKYRAAGFDRFEPYCEERWGVTRNRVDRVIKAGAIAEEIVPMGTIAPTHERQLRPLTALPDPDERVEAWEEAVTDAGGQQPTARQVEEAVERRRTISKPDLGGGISHPARFSGELIDIFRDLLHQHSFIGAKVLDPYAGTGGIHQLADEFDTTGIEREPEWANLNPRTQIGSALALPFDPATFDAIVTSPTYGNRLADNHKASDPEQRRSYTHDLGRELNADNSGAMHWRNGSEGSERYRYHHEKAWDEAVLVLKPGGIFILNFKDHWRDGALMPVGNWHSWCLGRLGLDYIDSLSVPTGNLRQGANGELRSVELVFVYGKSA